GVLAEESSRGGGAARTVAMTTAPAAALLGQAQIDGEADLSDQSAQLNAVWQEIELPLGIRHRGNLSATVRAPFPGGPQVRGNLVSRGTTPYGAWDALLELSGAGRAVSDIDWTAQLPRA